MGIKKANVPATNEYSGKYCSNVALLYVNWLNKLTLPVSRKKFFKTNLFSPNKPPPPPPPPPNA